MIQSIQDTDSAFTLMGSIILGPLFVGLLIVVWAHYYPHKKEGT